MSLLHIDMTQVVELLPYVSQEPIYTVNVVNIMAADDLATQRGQGISNNYIDYVEPDQLGHPR